MSMGPQRPYTRKITEVLEDGKTHTLEELTVVVGDLVPPGQAYRSALSGRKKSDSPDITADERNALIAAGRRKMVLSGARSLMKGGKIRMWKEEGRYFFRKVPTGDERIRELKVLFGELLILVDRIGQVFLEEEAGDG